jgi:DNA-binding transcriptional LysR family regulator
MTRSFDQVQLGSIEIFIKAAEAASFVGAANELGISPPAVSRSIARLEARLGVRLFARTTRQVKLTNDGRLYFEQCRQALRQIAETEDTLAGRHASPRGQLRLSVPTTYGHYRIVPLLPAFMRAYPDIQVEMNIANRNIDFVEEGYDLAIRLGELADNRLVARTLEDAMVGVYAAPSYLSERGTPRVIGDLERHDLIQFEMPNSGRPLQWIFRDKGKDIDFAFKSRVGFSEDVLGCINYARHGGGLFQTYDFITSQDVKAGALVEVMKRYRGRSRPFSIIYPQNRHLSPRVRVFVDFVLEAVRVPSASR